MPTAPRPEDSARLRIDAALEVAGWAVQDHASMNLSAGGGAHNGIAVRFFPMATGHGEADYLLFLGGQAVGVLEAKKEGATLTGVEAQAEKYATGLPKGLRVPVRPLPFNYLSNGRQTLFFNLLDPRPRSRRIALNDEIPHIHRPETLASWLAAQRLPDWIHAMGVAEAPPVYPELLTPPRSTHPSTFRSRIQALPRLIPTGLRAAQVTAIQNLETSMRDNRPRALLQMATGSGKTVVAVTEVYRLLKHAGAKRVLFLVDRANLGEQADKEFQAFVTPDTHRKFPELYNVQRLSSNTIAPSSAVVITTIQRLMILRGETEMAGDEEQSAFDAPAGPPRPAPVTYNPTLPPEYFDVVLVDECHRSIYSLWRQVLEYFDTFLVGLTATPSKLTYGFFNENLVMRYDHARAVADGVNVDYEVWRIRTQVSEQGARIEGTPGKLVRAVDKRRQVFRDVELDEDLAYDADSLDRAAANPSQIRTIVRAFCDALPALFPGRQEVPKTLVFCKDDDHAERVVTILREEFNQGNQFARKITYKAQGKPADMIQEFRATFWPRVAVTVDMIATGTDIRPVEVVLFLRSVRSRLLFEQMKGRGVRICDATEMQNVNGQGVGAKTRFVVVDAVGVTEQEFCDTRPLDRAPSVPLKALLDHVKAGGADPDYVSTLAARLLRLAKDATPTDVAKIRAAAGGRSIEALAQELLGAADAERVHAKAQEKAAAGGAALPEGWHPTETLLGDAAWELGRVAVRPFHDPKLRDAILEARRQDEMLLDEENQDVLLFSGAPEAQEKAARSYIEEFEQYLATHKAEIDALQFYFSIPQAKRPGYADVKALAQALRDAPEHFTTERLWRCYAQVRPKSVRSRRASDQLADVISLVRFAVHKDDELAPYADRVRERFSRWIETQLAAGKKLTKDQTDWLEAIRDHVATSVEITADDFDATPFAERGGLGAAARAFGGQIAPLLRELNEALAA